MVAVVRLAEYDSVVPVAALLRRIYPPVPNAERNAPKVAGLFGTGTEKMMGSA